MQVAVYVPAPSSRLGGGEVVNEFVRTSTHASAGGLIVTLAYEVCAREAALLCAGQRN